MKKLFTSDSILITSSKYFKLKPCNRQEWAKPHSEFSVVRIPLKDQQDKQLTTIEE